MTAMSTGRRPVSPRRGPSGVAVRRLAALRAALAFQVELHADLEEAERRQHARGFGPRHLVQSVNRPGQIASGRHGDREPQVELVVPLIIVAHAGMLVHHAGRRLQSVGPDPHRDQAALIAQTARVEDPADLPDQLLPLVHGDARDDLRLAEAQRMFRGCEKAARLNGKSAWIAFSNRLSWSSMIGPTPRPSSLRLRWVIILD